MNLNDIIADAVDKDELPSGQGGFEREIPRAGPALLRLRSYLELGIVKAKQAGHKDKRRVRLTFELHHPDHMITGTKADGTPFSFPGQISIYVDIAGPDSRFGRLFKAMNYDGDKTHMYQCVGMAFLGTITHADSGDPKKPWLNLDFNKTWNIGKPQTPVLDALGTPTAEMNPIPVPEMDGEPQVFLYEKDGLSDEQYKFLWDGIFIETPVSDDPTKPTKSRNWIQEAVKQSLDFDTSRLKGILDGSDALLEVDVPAQPIPTTTDADALAALGL